MNNESQELKIPISPNAEVYYKGDKSKTKMILLAWMIIRDDSKIKKYYFFPSILSAIFLTAVLTYQTIYTYVVIGNNKDVVLEKILHFLESKYVFEVVIVALVFLLLYFFLVPIFEAGLIKYIDAKSKDEPIGASEAFGAGMTKFLPFFEYGNLFSEFKLISILNFYLFTIRFVGIQYIKIITIIYLVLFFLGTIINILFTFSKYAIVIGNKQVFKAIGESSKIVILNLKKTIKLYFTLFLFNFRVILNILIFLFFPILIVVAFLYISSKFLMIITVTILSIIFVFIILCMGYLTGVMDIFKTAIWYFAYMDFKKKIDDDDDDDDD